MTQDGRRQDRGAMRQSLRHHILMLVVAGPIFFVNLGVPKLWDRDEPRNAGCAVEMMQRSDWVVPRFNDELRTDKPVLLYWFMVAAYGVFGVGEFAARFWSAVFGLGTVVATYHIGRRLFSPTIGFWAAVSLSSCMMFPVAARAATPDAILVFFTTLATLVYVYGAFPPRRGPASTLDAPLAGDAVAHFPSSWRLVALMYALMGAAVLAKGPVGFLLPTAVIGMFLLIVRLPEADARRQVSPDAFVRFVRRLLRPFGPRHFFAVFWSMRPLTALAALVVVALPWYVLVGLRTGGQWLQGFFLVHNFQRAAEPMEGHSGPLFYYLMVIIPIFFPWSLLLIPAVEHTVNRIRRRLASYPQYVFVACWAALYIVAFSFAQTKLPSYITPALPAVALMTGCFVDRSRRQWRAAADYWFRFAFTALILVGIGLGIGGFVAGGLLLGDGWLGLVGAIPFAGGLAGWYFLRHLQPRHAVAAFALTAILFAGALFGFASLRVARHQRFDVLLSAAYAKTPQPQIAAYGCFEPSWVFYARRPIGSLANDDPEQVADFLLHDEARFLITTDAQWDALGPSLPETTAVLAKVPYFLRQEQLVLIGRRERNRGAEGSERGFIGHRRATTR